MADRAGHRCGVHSSGALVLVVTASGTTGQGVDLACLAIIGARVPPSLVHLYFVQTNAVVSVRFAFYLVQAMSYLFLAGAIVRHVLAGAA